MSNIKLVGIIAGIINLPFSIYLLSQMLLGHVIPAWSISLMCLLLSLNALSLILPETSKK